MSLASPPQRSRYHVNAIERGLTILSQFHQGRPSLSLTEIAAGLDCALSSAMRLLRTLEDLGFVEQDFDSGRFRPGLAAARLGYAALVTSDLHQVSVPILCELFDRLRVNVNLDVLVDGEACRIERLKTVNLLPDELAVGSLFPVYCTAAGRALIMRMADADIDRILSAQRFERYTATTPMSVDDVKADIHRSRERGYVFSDQEYSLHLQVVAAPILDGRGRTLAAVSISSPTHSVTTETVHRVHALEVMAAALRIAARLAAAPGAEAA